MPYIRMQLTKLTIVVRNLLSVCCFTNSKEKKNKNKYLMIFTYVGNIVTLTVDDESERLVCISDVKQTYRAHNLSIGNSVDRSK